MNKSTSTSTEHFQQHKDIKIKVNGSEFGKQTTGEAYDSTEARRNEHSAVLQKLLEVQASLKENIATEIVFSPPIIKKGSDAIIFPNTLIAVQGQTGVHKSRFAEVVCFVLLSLFECKNSLGLVSNTQDIHVLYADTERNLKDQLPYALQQIVYKSGYQKSDPPSNLSFISLLDIERTKRFNALRVFIEHLRSTTDKHLFIVLDVVTDCISDFNDTGDTMQLIDMINAAINNLNCTFLCIIHENPGTEKARGHIGTELMNKASTGIQISFVKQKNKETQIIEIKFLKTRSTAKPESIFCQYSDEIRGLKLLDESDMPDEDSVIRDKAISELRAIALNTMTALSAIGRNQLEDKVMVFLTTSESTAKRRVRELLAHKFIIKSNDGLYRLSMPDEGSGVRQRSNGGQ